MSLLRGMSDVYDKHHRNSLGATFGTRREDIHGLFEIVDIFVVE